VLPPDRGVPLPYNRCGRLRFFIIVNCYTEVVVAFLNHRLCNRLPAALTYLSTLVPGKRPLCLGLGVVPPAVVAERSHFSLARGHHATVIPWLSATSVPLTVVSSWVLTAPFGFHRLLLPIVRSQPSRSQFRVKCTLPPV